MTHNTQSTPAVFGPADIIASLPGVLGFYPQESALIIHLVDTGDGDMVRLGPVLRADLCHTAQLEAGMREIPDSDRCARAALIVTRIPNSDLARDACETLYGMTGRDGDLLVDLCWHVSEIAAGTPYSLLFGPLPGDFLRSGMASEWVTGTVNSVVTQPTMQALLAQGALPELSREDTRAYFDPVDRDDLRAARDAAPGIYRLGQTLAGAVRNDAPLVRDAMRDACEVLRNAPDAPLVGAPDQRLGEVFAAEEDLEILAAALSRTQLRDCLFSTALEHPQSSGAALLAVARNFDGVIRANALSLWAVVAVKLQLSSWAGAALECAQEEVPDHSLSEILHILLRTGNHAGVLECAEFGCAGVWEDLAGPDAPERATSARRGKRRRALG